MTERTERRVVTRDETVIIGWSCDRCGADIERYGSDYGAADALPVTFGGYYGGYFDTLHSNPKWLLCKACADALLDAFPFFKVALDKFIAVSFGIYDTGTGERLADDGADSARTEAVE